MDWRDLFAKDSRNYMKLHELKPKIKKKRKRIGRGGKRGTYSGRGIKGQKARAGAKIRPGFAGGTTPLYRQLPKKRGFKSLKIRPAILNVEDLQKRFKSGDVIDIKKLVEAGLIKHPKVRLKILGDGELTKKFHVFAHAFSRQAKEKIEKAKGKAVEVEKVEEVERVKGVEEVKRVEKVGKVEKVAEVRKVRKVERVKKVAEKKARPKKK